VTVDFAVLSFSDDRLLRSVKTFQDSEHTTNYRSLTHSVMTTSHRFVFFIRRVRKFAKVCSQLHCLSTLRLGLKSGKNNRLSVVGAEAEERVEQPA
jgi:hypothetical protein